MFEICSAGLRAASAVVFKG